MGWRTEVEIIVKFIQPSLKAERTFELQFKSPSDKDVSLVE